MTPADSTLADPSDGAVWCGTSRPILFSGEMVKAILDDRKTQTRRLVKLPPWFLDEYPRHGAYEIQKEIDCPYGKPGDRLWVREAHALETLDGDERVVYREGLAARWRGEGEKLFYLAKDDAPKRWRPSIHMPRWASRITLSITEVRVQRLQSITPEDVRAEGVAGWTQGTAFERLWDSINAKRAPWASNPWIYAVTFSRVP